jgi:hypothetical protein
MTETKVKYTEEEIFQIFKEQHRLCSPLDPEAEPWAEISAEMTVKEWRWANDLLEWKELSTFLDQEFRIAIPQAQWFQILEPAKTKKLIDVCRLISKYAVKNIYEPKTLFGRPCIKAGVFLTIKKNLKDKGVNVSDLRPSSLLVDYMDKYFTPIVEEITLTGTKPIEKIEIRRKKSGFWNAINIFDPDRYETLSGEIITFRDLTEKIIEEKMKTECTKGA